MKVSINMNRRNFVQALCAATAAAGLQENSGMMAAAQDRTHRNPAAGGDHSATLQRKNFVGIQVKPFAWVDEGIDQLLDTVQSKGNVNTIFVYTYDGDPNRTRKGGSIPLPDHGKYGPDQQRIGGAFFDYDQKYFRDTTIREFRSPDEPNFNVITAVAPKMKARGMDFFAWDYNNAFPSMMQNTPGLTEVAEVDVYGRRTTSACFNNPNYRAHLTGKIECLLSQYSSEVQGVMWGCERMGPIDNMIGGGWATTGISCFCPYCTEKARTRGISVERAKTGYSILDRLFHQAGKKNRPADGYFVTFMRTLIEYPEVLAWNALWNDSYHEVRSALYGTAKAIAPQKPFGFHVVQNVTFSPFYSAVDDYAKLADYSDFLKIACYNNAGGPRMAHFVDRLCSTVFADASPSDLQPLYYKMMGYDQPSLDEIRVNGLSPEYVTGETRRAIQGTGGKVQIYPGIDIDVPTAVGEKHTSPDDVKAAASAALNAGANGVVLSREYHEMWLKNLTAAGDATRALFKEMGS
jgi:hypothetical protein